MFGLQLQIFKNGLDIKRCNAQPIKKILSAANPSSKVLYILKSMTLSRDSLRINFMWPVHSLGNIPVVETNNHAHIHSRNS